jgi:hypothetical protein
VPHIGEDAGELGLELGLELGTDRIERARPLEREHEYAAAAFDGNAAIGLIAGHGVPLRLLIHRVSTSWSSVLALAACIRAVHAERNRHGP